MSNLEQVIDFAKQFQDIELATAVGQLKQNPAQLQQFLQEQQSKVYSDVVKQKDSTFQKVYGDLNRASQAQEAAILLDKRNKQLETINKQIYTNQKREANAVIEDKNLAGRKYEMNQWSVGNKNDTLFVFSFLFIVLSALILFTVLWRMGLISSALCATLSIPFIIIFILVVINRSMYTNNYRDNRYWNRNTFGGKSKKIPIPVCPGALSGIEKEFGSVESSVESGFGSLEQRIGSAAQSASQELASVSQNLQGSK
jgi:hypothetical protein